MHNVINLQVTFHVFIFGSATLANIHKMHVWRRINIFLFSRQLEKKW